jgi:uncharacterized membrane protein YdjX (TVP38/TMEM64 family)
VGVDVTRITPERVQAFVLSFGVWAPAIYLLVYGQPLVPLPASVMTMAGGLVFGPLWGTVAAVIGATVRACGQFFIAKCFGRRLVETLLSGKFARLDQQVGQHGFQTVLLVRFIPNVPFDMQNYGLGFSQVRFSPYALATLLGMIPGSFVFVYFGYSLTDLRNAWKVLAAIVLILGLMLGQRWYAKCAQH